MQSYDVWELIPRKCAKSSSTCVDNCFIFGQIGNNSKKVVQRFVFFPLMKDVCEGLKKSQYPAEWGYLDQQTEYGGWTYFLTYLEPVAESAAERTLFAQTGFHEAAELAAAKLKAEGCGLEHERGDGLVLRFAVGSLRSLVGRDRGEQHTGRQGRIHAEVLLAQRVFWRWFECWTCLCQY